MIEKFSITNKTLIYFRVKPRTDPGGRVIELIYIFHFEIIKAGAL